MILIGVGANIDSPYGSPRQTIKKLPDLLKPQGIKLVKLSSLLENPAWPNADDPPFVNAVMQVETSLSPHDLLNTLNLIEKKCGRERSAKNAPRPLDLDILDYNGIILDDDALTLPHPHMLERDFVMKPLKEIAPNWTPPR